MSKQFSLAIMLRPLYRRRMQNLSLMDKAALRGRLRARRAALPEDIRLSLSRQATAHILAHARWRQAERVALYMAARGELDTAPLLDAAWAGGKTVLLPLCSRTEASVMRFLPVSGREGLRPGPFGILEPQDPDDAPPYTADAPGMADAPGTPDTPDTPPTPDAPPAPDTPGTPPTPDSPGKASAPVPDIIVVPGVAFDRQGGRLGQGGGYYDRLLGSPAYAACLRIGLAYAFQVLDRLPRDDWDVPVHALCTEEGLLWLQNI